MLDTTLRQLSADARGGIAVWFAVALLPIAMLVGAATDLRRVEEMRSRVQDASDAAVLAASKAYAASAAREPARLAAAKAAAGHALEANLFVADGSGRKPPPGLEDMRWNVAPNQKGELVLSLDAQVPLTFAGVLGVPSTPIQARSASLAGSMKRLEVALVLDNTGSMAAGNKIGILKDATRGLVTELETVARRNPALEPLKIALIPFSMTVRLDQPEAYRASGWVTGTPTHPSYRNLFADPAREPADRFERLPSWEGCVESRPAPFDVEERAPRPADRDSLFVPYLNPETGNGNGNRGCDLSPLTRLTADIREVKTAANRMRATGNTNIPMGLAWGWHALSPQGPFRDGDPYGAPDLIKVVVLMTDGQNNISLSPRPEGAPYTGVGMLRQNRIGVGPASSLAERRDALDRRLAALCGNVKARGIVIYTVRVNTPGSPDIMRDCASGPGAFFDVKNPEDLPEVFSAIAGRITQLRLSQ